MPALAVQRIASGIRINGIGALFVFVLPLVLAGCSTAQLRPAPTAQLFSADTNAAVANDSGVRMVLAADAWSANPYSLEAELTPLEVTIENNTGAPLQIRYENVKLVSSSGITYSALPPLKIEGTATKTARSPVYVPRFGYHRFSASPFYAPFYAGLRPWPYRWTHDPFYYDRYYPTWQLPLPTKDMIEMALPEGVLEAGGRISGFLYFQETGADADRVSFRADLVNAKTGDSFGAITIPFVTT